MAWKAVKRYLGLNEPLEYILLYSVKWTFQPSMTNIFKGLWYG